MIQKKSIMSRRAFFQKYAAASAGVAAGSLVTNDDYEAIAQNVTTNSQPSNLKITDMRLARIGHSGMVRIDTNQGISGYGELYVQTTDPYALMLKHRIVGMNPCNVDKIFRKIKQFGYHARQGGGVSGVEVACWDLAGKALGVPVYRLLGGKFRDKIRIYSDTTTSTDPEVMGKRLKERMDRGITYLKMDFNILRMCRNIEGAITEPEDNTGPGFYPHPFTGTRITDKGLKAAEEYVAVVRDIIGWEIPLALDHFGHFPVKECIKIAQTFDKFNLAWLEDMVPWQYTDKYVMLKNSCDTPILTGEDIYCKEGFMDLFKKKAIDICHPDVGWCGGILEAKKIGDLAMEHDIPMAMHQAGNPTLLLASVHCAAATENFMVLEHHNIDDPLYHDLVDGVSKPFDQDGYIPVPDTPGLGFTLNEEACKKSLREPGYFEPTPDWDIDGKNYKNQRSWDRLWSFSKPQANKPSQI